MSSRPDRLPGIQELRFRAAGRLGDSVLSGILTSCSLEVSGEEGYRGLWTAGQPVIFVLWHGRLLAPAYQQRGKGIVVLISQHRDGEYITRVVERWGYDTVRGSSTRGGSAALRSLMRRVRLGRSVVLTPDGPRGPKQKMKPGALLVAQLTGAPIVPVAAGARRCWWVGSWDRFQVPKPFSRIRIRYGEPLTIPRDAAAEALTALSDQVEARLNALMEQVDAGW